MAIDVDRARRVASDMQRIFADTARPATAIPVRAMDEPSAPRRRARWVMLAAPLLVVLLVVALAVHAGLSLGSGARAVALKGVPVASASATLPTPVPTEMPNAAPSADLPSPAITQSEALAFPEHRVADDTSHVPVARGATSTTTTSGRDDADDAACPPGSQLDRCIYRDVTRADRRLRAAYDDATRAGAPTEDLAAIRRNWNQARDISLDDPDETIRRYDRLTEALDDLTRGASR